MVALTTPAEGVIATHHTTQPSMIVVDVVASRAAAAKTREVTDAEMAAGVP